MASSIISNISSSMTDTSNKINYSFNNTINSSFYGIPLITIGLIGITSIVLAYVTIVETDETQSETLMDLPPTNHIGGGKKHRKTHKKHRKSTK